MTSISFVTTCKGRLRHLQRTLPLLIAEYPEEIVVVDYGCPDGSGDWVQENFPLVKVVRVTDDDSFCAARARNLGAEHVTSQWICFIDADIQVSPGWVHWMKLNLDSRFYYRSEIVNGARERDTWGTFICDRETFNTTGCYDEIFRGWGGEDDDLYKRLFLNGIAESFYPGKYVLAINHTDEERLQHYPQKDINTHHIINRFYLEAKFQLMMIGQKRTNPPWQARMTLMNKIKETLAEWEDGKGDKNMPEVSISSAGSAWLPAPYKMRKTVYVTLSMDIASDISEK